MGLQLNHSKKVGISKEDAVKLSTKGRYGLKAMFDLALNYSETPVPLTDVSARQQISPGYLEQIMIPLRKAGLVTSVRGASGGYLLSRSADQITVGQVLMALEGSLAPAACLNEDVVSDECDCVPKLVYSKIYDGILGVVNNLTLQDMKTEYYQNFMVSEILVPEDSDLLGGVSASGLQKRYRGEK